MDRQDQFSYAGKIALFEYLEEEEMENSDFERVGIELDVISLCCEFTEYENLDVLNKQMGKEYKTEDDIQFDTQVVMYTDSENPILIRNF